MSSIADNEPQLSIDRRDRRSLIGMSLVEAWRRLVPEADELGAQLLARWSQPHRKYHTVDHLVAVLVAFLLGGLVVSVADDLGVRGSSAPSHSSTS